jgi:shikimate kinase
VNLAPAMTAVAAVPPSMPGPIVVWGYMGAGKSTVARALADRLGLRFVDLDEVIAERTRMSVSTFFATRGEAAFRDVEQAVLSEVSRSGGVVLAVGGGALLDPGVRARVRAAATLVTLSVSPAVAARRLASAPGEAARRPLFDDAFEARFAARAAAYADADLIIDTDAATPDEVVGALEGALRARGVL